MATQTYTPKFMSGAYRVIYYVDTVTTVDVGQTQGGISLSWQFHKQPIVGDYAGQTVQDMVFQGTNVALAFQLIEWEPIFDSNIFWPYGDTWFKQTTMVGSLDIACGQSHKMQLSLLQVSNPCPDFGTVGTPPVSKNPNTITFDRVTLMENTGADIRLAPELRVVPLRFRVLPVIHYDDATNELLDVQFATLA